MSLHSNMDDERIPLQETIGYETLMHSIPDFTSIINFIKIIYQHNLTAKLANEKQLSTK